MKLRHELKHTINECDRLILSSRLRNVMDTDPHANADGTYLIKSLYFDSYTDKALREKLDGLNRREKFRIRYYNDDTSFLRLEKKSKINNLCHKASAVITAGECAKIISGDTDFLLEKDSELLKEFYAKQKYHMLRPKVIVAYNRESFVKDVSQTRVTLDSNIRGSTNVWEFLNPDLCLTHLYPHSVLEVKYNEFLPDSVKKAVTLPSRRAGAFSKYAAVRYY